MWTIPRAATSALLAVCALTLHAAQDRPYIGFLYPAGARQGTTVEVRLGGQALDDLTGVLVTGPGVTAKVTDYYRRLNMEELQILSDQLYALREVTLSDSARAELERARQEYTMSDLAASTPAMAPKTNAQTGASVEDPPTHNPKRDAAQKLMARIEHRTLEFNSNPASEAIASLAIIEVTVAPDAPPGERELRLITLKGASNPLPFHIGQLPEVSRQPMLTASHQVLGKESDALRPEAETEEDPILTLPCVVNGQVASGEVSRYRFAAHQGQRLVISAMGRQLVPFMADAVPGWVQLVLALYDSEGREVAYNDDYRFKPDPTIFYEVPKDGEYTFALHDALYRGREDFVYRITVGELPFITSLFPLGDRAGVPVQPEIKGWNLKDSILHAPPAEAGVGVYSLTTQSGQSTRVAEVLASSRSAPVRLTSNPVLFARDTLPEVGEREPNNAIATAQKITLPVIVNGRIDRPGDVDVFQFQGRAGDTLAAEVSARRLDSPLDSVLKLTDAAGHVLAYNDDHEDLGAGLNTHHADSYFMVRLPADGDYFVHLGDVAHQGGEEYGYRLRLSAPRPDFELRVVPSSVALESKSTNSVAVYVMRKDGFDGPIQVTLSDPPGGMSAQPLTLASTQTVAHLVIKTELIATRDPLPLRVIGAAKSGATELAHEAVPCEDRMQAFLWRHLVPAKELVAVVSNPSFIPPFKRTPTVRPRLTPAVVAAAATNSVGGTNTPAPPKISKEQIAARVHTLRRLFEEGLLTDDFYNDQVAQVDVAQ